MDSIHNLSRHLELNPGASEPAIRDLVEETGFDFPADYLEFLRCANGGDTNIDRDTGGESALWRLFPVEEIVEVTRDYFWDVEAMNEVSREFGSPVLPEGQLPWMIGDTGADVGFCLDPRFRKPRFISAKLGCIQFDECGDLGESFLEFLTNLNGTGEGDWKPLRGIDRSLVKRECWPGLQE